MKTPSEEHITLITRYLSGETSPGEMADLQTWIQESPENAEYFQSMFQVWNLSQHLTEDISVESEWEKFQVRTPETKSVKSVYFFRRPLLLRIAALVVLAIVSGYIAWYISFSDQGQWLKAKNGHSEFLLPDGSHLTLMKGSSAYFDETYGTLNRHLKVYGNAYLDIKKDTSLPFTAECGQLHLRVTGTTFFVGSGDIHSPAYVILSSGKVTVNPVSEPQKTIFLFPGQMAKILDGIPQLDTIPNPNLTAWKTLQFQFDGTPLPEALTFLAEAYNIPIRLDATFPHDCTITASFQNQTPDVILKVICSALGLQMESYKKGFRLYGEACR